MILPIRYPVLELVIDTTDIYFKSYTRIDQTLADISDKSIDDIISITAVIYFGAERSSGLAITIMFLHQNISVFFLKKIFIVY